MWEMVALWVVTTIISYALRPKTDTQRPRPGNIEVPTAEAGRKIPVLFGTKAISGVSVAWYGDVMTQAIKSKGGKK